MTEDEQVQDLVKQWRAHHLSGAVGNQITTHTLNGMAWLALRKFTSLPPECGAAHPQRLWITCTHYQGHAVPQAHRNEQLGLDWHEDGSTIHDELGDITLVYSDPEPEQATNGVDLDQVQMLLAALGEARGALAAVDKKYLSTSKVINSPLVNQVRRAARHVDDVVKEIATELGEGTTP